MKTKVFENFAVKYEVPDGVKIEDGKCLQAMITPNLEEKVVKVTKAERTGRKTSERNYLYQGKNLSLTLNTDDRIARGTLKLRANEDWVALRVSVMKELEEAYNELMKVIEE